jgi:hypothetical protein
MLPATIRRRGDTRDKPFRNLLTEITQVHTVGRNMNALPQTHSSPRSPRLHFPEGSTPAVLRRQDGERISAELQVVSLTGGLLSVPRPLAKGSTVKLMFVTSAGSVLGGAQMLNPVTNNLQPFRFLTLAQRDRRTLESVIPVSVYQDITEPAWMKKLRAASDQRYEPQPWRFKIAVGAAALIALGLMGGLYFRHFQLLKWFER